MTSPRRGASCSAAGPRACARSARTGGTFPSAPDGAIIEVPVTTFPLLRLPIHISYLLYLDAVHPRLAEAYFRVALRACAMAGVGPSLLLHPLDFLGADDVAGLEFFPGMDMAGARKRERVGALIGLFAARFDVVGVGAHAAAVADRTGDRPVMPADLSTPDATPAAVLGRLRQRWRLQGRGGHG